MTSLKHSKNHIEIVLCFKDSKGKLLDDCFEEIENMIQIFNHDIEPEEFEKINNILKIFLPLQKYSLIRNGKVIDINSRIDLEKIWK